MKVTSLYGASAPVAATALSAKSHALTATAHAVAPPTAPPSIAKLLTEGAVTEHARKPGLLDAAWHPKDLGPRAQSPVDALARQFGKTPIPGFTGGEQVAGDLAKYLPGRRTGASAYLPPGNGGPAGLAFPGGPGTGSDGGPAGGPPAGVLPGGKRPGAALPTNWGAGDDAPVFNIPGVKAPPGFPTGIDDIIPNHRAAPSGKKAPAAEPAKPKEDTQPKVDDNEAWKPNAADEPVDTSSPDDAKRDKTEETKPDPNARPADDGTGPTGPRSSGIYRPADDGTGPVGPRSSGVFIPADDGTGPVGPRSYLDYMPADDGTGPTGPNSVVASKAAIRNVAAKLNLRM